MSFLEVIGKHVQSSGLQEAWRLERVQYAKQVLSGKSHAKGMRTHKLTLQALQRLLAPQLLKFISEEYEILGKQIEEKIPLIQ